MNSRNNIDVNDLSIDTNLTGVAMRDELISFYNKLVYWNEQHSQYDGEKKALENMLEEAKDKARAIRAVEAEQKGIKAKIQEAYIKDIWAVEIEVLDTSTGEILRTNCSALQAKYTVACQKESHTRHKMNLCSTCLDIGRSSLSWDKQELMKLDTAHHST